MGQEATRGRIGSWPAATWLAGALGLAVLVVAVVIGVRVVSGPGGTVLERVLASVPAEGLRFTYTDWAGVRDEMGMEFEDPTPAQLREFLDAGYEADLSSTSALVESSETAQVQFGFSPATIEWEMLAQWEQGSTITVKMPEGFDYEGFERTLERVGFGEPKDDGLNVWQGDADVLARLGSLTPFLQFIAVLPAQQVIVASNTAGAAATGAQSAKKPHDLDEGIGEVAEATGNALTAAIYTDTYACEALAMANADPVDQAEGLELVSQAGKVNPYQAFSLAAERGMGVRVAMSFETDDQARTNAATRDSLIRGPAPGQGGAFTDRFDVEEVKAEGSVLTIDVNPTAGSYVISDLSSGPVLFATC